MKWPSHHVNAIRNQKVISVWNPRRCAFSHVNASSCTGVCDRPNHPAVWSSRGVILQNSMMTTITIIFYSSVFLSYFSVNLYYHLIRVYDMLIFPLGKLISHIVIFLHFHSTKKALLLVDSWSRGLDLNQLYPDRTLSNVLPSEHIAAVIKAWWKVPWQKVGKTPPVFFLWMNTTTQTWSLKL